MSQKTEKRGLRFLGVRDQGVDLYYRRLCSSAGAKPVLLFRKNVVPFPGGLDLPQKDRRPNLPK
jgi:hypothetical protein